MEEPDTPGADDLEEEEGEGEGEGRGVKRRQFNQVWLQSHNRMILIAVLTEQKEKVSRVSLGFTLSCVCVCVCVCVRARFPLSVRYVKKF